MKSCLGILLVLFTLVAVIGGGALIWYLSNTAEFTRKGAGAATPSGSPPKALVPIPKDTLKATVPIPDHTPKATVPIPKDTQKAVPVR